MEALGLDWKIFLAQIINFGILFYILKKLLYKPLTKAIDDRNKKIDDALENSKKIDEKLKKIEDESLKILEKARIKAKEERTELLQQSAEDKNKIVNEAKMQAKREIEKGLQSIEAAKEEAVKNISDKYLESITQKLYSKLSKEAQDKKNPLLKTLLK